MTPLTVNPNIDNTPWKDCADLKEIGLITRIGRLPKGTEAGKSTVTILVEMKDGTRVMAQTTLALMNSAMLMMNGSAEMEGEVVG